MVRSTFNINSSHFTSGNLYTYKLLFPLNVGDDNQATISVASFAMYNSTYNISEELGNNKVYYTWIDGMQYVWTIEDGYYSVDKLNIWLQSKLIQYKLYAITLDKSENIYFTQFIINSVAYKNEIDIFYVPTATEASTEGLTKPSGATWSFPAQRALPIFSINPNLKLYFGQSTKTTFGDETNQTKHYQYLSDITPTISPTFVIQVTCNLIKNAFADNPTLLTQFPIKASYGDLLSYETMFESRVSVRKGIYPEIIIQLWNQNGKPLQYKDKDFTMVLLIDY